MEGHSLVPGLAENAVIEGGDDAFALAGPITLVDLEWSVAHSFEDIRASWQELQRSAVFTPFQSLEWTETWYETIGRKRGCRPRIVTAKRAGRALLLFPLVLSARWRLKQLTWIAGQWNDYNAPVIDASFFSRLAQIKPDELWREVTRLVPEADLLSLPKQPEKIGSHSNPFILAGCLEPDGAHAITLGGNWDEFQERWGKTSRRRFRQKRNQLARKGKVEYSIAEKPAERRKAVGIILKWKSDQLEARGARNPFEDGDFIAFLQNVAERWDDFRIHLLLLDERPIAGVLALEEAQSSLIYQMCFDPAYDRQSPGRLLLDNIIQKHVEGGRAVLDLGYGDEAYKAKLTDKSMSLYRGLRGLGPAGKLECFAEKRKLQAERFVKSRPRLLQLYYALRSSRSTAHVEE